MRWCSFSTLEPDDPVSKEPTNQPRITSLPAIVADFLHESHSDSDCMKSQCRNACLFLFVCETGSLTVQVSTLKCWDCRWGIWIWASFSVVLICIFLMVKNAEHFLTCLLAFFKDLIGISSVHLPASRLAYSFFDCSLYIPDISSLSDERYSAFLILQAVAFSIVSFAVWKHFNLVPFINSSSYFLYYWGLTEKVGPVRTLSELRHLLLKPGKPTVFPGTHIEVEGENPQRKLQSALPST